jgi:hypothetical protein
MPPKNRSAQERFEELSARIADSYADMPEEEGMAEIKRVTDEVRRELKSERALAKNARKPKQP